MKLYSLITLLLASLLGSMAMAASQPSDMKLVLDKQGIRIWSYAVPGSPLHGFKAVTTVRSNLNSIVGLIADTEAASRWLYRTSEVETLKRNDEDMSFVIRVVTDFPWPFKDREAVVAGRITQDPKTMIVRIDSNTVSGFATRPGNLNMPLVQGSWQFRPVGHGLVEITMTGHADPGGNLPASLVNMFIQEHPYNSLLALKNVIAEPNFQTARLASIREPVYQ
ncbi:polyketide cyclase/dehydrase/lipid transport protein [Fluviicoccus keumensis]|uniref:Polyketide cyclase/dehydrase/lipid transport protein n=1 Tax=Fluviicoccus keumensis TaxID=1435465 RepID=A0A4Q7YKQ2_9GAMM|nr:SRPBCC family protein [Fluviicoccus keumensis]RZU38107.1 polyketide cyclase/dehydrase/lipid transport protein [Fluviicoccus keumensis]